MMFKRLRNKILFINMLLTSMIVVIAFTAIYLIMNYNIQSENMRKLETSVPMVQVSVKAISTNIDGTFHIDDETLPVDSLLSFNITVNQDGTIEKVNSPVDIPEDFFHQAVQSVWKNEAKSGQIKLDDKIWLYSVTPNIMTGIISGNDMEISFGPPDGTSRISFLDITDSLDTLRNLALSFVAVGFVMLAVIFLISLVFANRSIKPVSEAWEKQRQFIADASHELKTPLSIINANYDVLLANKNETIISQMKWFEYMKIGTDRMADLINRLLSLAGMENSDLEVKKALFNMSETVFETLQPIEAAIYQKKITLCQSIESGIIVSSDRELVSQVLTILYDNAVKYTEPNGQIDVALTQSNHQAVFSVRNSGKGIPAQDLSKIFDRFYRGDQSRTYENGSYGLGLSIAKAITDALGGEIQVQSVEGAYTTFTFRLNQ